MKNFYLTLILIVCGIHAGLTQQISVAEYAIDTDPGVGQGTRIDLSDNDSVDTELNIPVGSLEPGVHVLFLRLQDENGVWSHTRRRVFYVEETADDLQHLDIVEAELLIDSETGYGTGQHIDLIDSDSVDQIANYDINGLSPGHHTLSFRVKDELGRWSHTLKRNFYVEKAGDPVQDVKIVEAELLIDSETGYRTGQRIDLSDSDSLDQIVNHAISGLSPGNHTLLFRVKDDLGRWSHTRKRNFHVEKANDAIDAEIIGGEYFFDADPGTGKGTALSYSTNDTILSTENISVSGISPGWHYLGMRLRDNLGVWSMPVYRKLFIDTIQLPVYQEFEADKIEWWIDQPPVQGTGAVEATEVGDSSKHNLHIPMGSYGPGLHELYVRYHSTSGMWSAPERRFFWLQEIYLNQDSSASQITRAEYFFDTDPGFGNGTAVTVDNEDTLRALYTIPLSGLSPGFHTLFIRTQNDFGFWTSLETRQIYIQDIPLPAEGPADINRGEYFIGDDPGVGNGVPLSVTASDSVSIREVIDVSLLNLDEDYPLSFRFRDAKGNWSHTSTELFRRVDCDLPGQPLLPSGPANICSGAGIGYTYFSNIPEFTDTLVWGIEEEHLVQNGTISFTGEGDSVRLVFNDAYNGTLRLRLRGENDCVWGAWSESLLINVTGITELPGEPIGIADVCAGLSNTYRNDSVAGATSFEWLLVPEEAGLMISHDDSVSIHWSISYHGQANLSYKYSDGCSESSFSHVKSIMIHGPETLPAPVGDRVICEETGGVFVLEGLDTTVYKSTSWRSVPGGFLTPETISVDTIVANWSFGGNPQELGLLAEVSNFCGRTNLTDTLFLTPLTSDLPLEFEKPQATEFCSENPINIDIPVLNHNGLFTYEGRLMPDSAGSVAFVNQEYKVFWSAIDSWPDSVELVLSVYGICNDTVRTDSSLWIRFTKPVDSIKLTAPDTLCRTSETFKVLAQAWGTVNSYKWNLEQASISDSITTDSVFLHPGFADAVSGNYIIRVQALSVCEAYNPVVSRTLHLKADPAAPEMPVGAELVCDDPTVYRNPTGLNTNDYVDYSWTLDPQEAGVATNLQDSAVVDWTTGFEGLVSIRITGETECGELITSEPLQVYVIDRELDLRLEINGLLSSCSSEPDSLDIRIRDYSENISYNGHILPDSAGTVVVSGQSFQVAWNDLASYPDSARVQLSSMAVCGDTLRADTTVWVYFIHPVETLELVVPDTLCSSADPFNVIALNEAHIDSFRWVLPFMEEMTTQENSLLHPGFNNVTDGAGYIAKVYPINACGMHENGFNDTLHIKSAPDVPLAPAGPSAVCAIDSTIFLNPTGLGTNDYISYSWSVEPAEAASVMEFQDSIILKWNQKYDGAVNLKISGETDCGLTRQSLIKNVYAHASKFSSRIIGDSLLCPNDTSTFRLVSDLRISRVYDWEFSESVEGLVHQQKDSIFSFIVPPTQLPGEVELRAQIASECESVESSPIKISFNPLPPVEEIIGADTVCVADTNIYTVSNFDLYHLKWEVEGLTQYDTTGYHGNLALLRSQPEQQITIGMVYTEKATGCARSRQKDVFSLRSPEKQDIVIKGNRILIYKDMAAAAYQWYLNNTAIPGATGQFYAAPDSSLAPGNYHVVAENQSGCKVASDKFPIQGSLKSSALPVFKLVPNPATSLFRIVFEEGIEGEVRIQVFDSRSVIRYNEDIDLLPMNGPNSVELDCGSWDRGIYFIKVIRDGVPYVEKIILM